MATVAYLILRYPLCDWFGCIHKEGSRLEQVCICIARPAVAFVIIHLHLSDTLALMSLLPLSMD